MSGNDIRAGICSVYAESLGEVEDYMVASQRPRPGRLNQGRICR